MGTKLARTITDPLYESDFHAWTEVTAEQIRRRQFHQLDPEAVAEEIESLGRSLRNELHSRLTLILTHRLKWDFQPGKRSRSWVQMVKIQRAEIKRLVRKNPSLQPVLEDHETLTDAYEVAVIHAASETGMAEHDFPAQRCPYTIDQTLNEQFWPEP